MFAGTGCCGRPRNPDRRPSTHPASAWVSDDSVLGGCRGVAGEYRSGPNDDVMVMPLDEPFDDYNAERLRAAVGG